MRYGDPTRLKNVMLKPYQLKDQYGLSLCAPDVAKIGVHAHCLIKDVIRNMPCKRGKSLPRRRRIRFRHCSNAAYLAKQKT
jgi:hypothetical protein